MISRMFSPLISFFLTLSSAQKAERSEGECSSDEEDEGVAETEENMPPGKWRVGHKFNNTHTLYLRFATKGEIQFYNIVKRLIGIFFLMLILLYSD